MKIHQFTKWEGFEKEVLSKRRHVEKNPSWQLLFRGQRCASWKLLTTLERDNTIDPCEMGYASRQLTYDEYYREIVKDERQVQLLAKKGLALPTICPHPASDEYMNCLVHLRQEGFRSPLLDWSLDENVAAFFAFRKLVSPNCNNVAIFLYVQYPQGFGFLPSPDEPRIIPIKCDAPSVCKHVRQKTKFTVCLTQSHGRFCSHEDVFVKDQTGQDLLVKYLIPGSERDKVLEKLRSKGYTEDYLLENSAILS
jgi:hypothetical protein